MPGPFQSRVAARFIAILCLVGLCAEGAMAQSAPQLLLATRRPTDMVAEVAPAPTSLKPSGFALAKRASETRLPNYFGAFFDRRETSAITNNATYFSNAGSSAISNIPTSSPIASNAIDPIRRARFDVLSAFITAYNSLRKSLAVSAKSLIQKYATRMRATVVGVASTYNPYLDHNGSDEKQTASGNPYDPTAWAAAIRIDLREQFGGVRYGKNYQPTFALVESGEKYVIVKINDVGPLKPGRVIDLNERSMRYFDPTQQLELISDVKVTPLPGEDWTPGPIGSDR
jgi:rare lipoprotein A